MAPACSNPPDGGRGSPLCVEFEIVLGDVATCPIRDEVRAASEVRQECVDGACHVDATVSDGDGRQVVHVEDSVEPACPCPIFRDHGCIPSVTGVTDRGFSLEVYVPDREVLRSCVDTLKARVAELELLRLQMDPEPEADDVDAVVLNLEDLTEKQRTAAVRAMAAGYYERPRETSLEELAEDLGISKSALSQRLSAVESKLAKAAFGSACGCEDGTRR